MGLKWYRGGSRGQWMALLAALLGWMFDGFEQGIIPLVARPALIDVLDLAPRTAEGATPAGDKSLIDQQVGLWNGRITAAFLLGAAFGGWAFGWLGDRIGRVRAMVFSVLTYAVFTGLCGLAQTGWQLAGLRFLAALGMGGEWALGVALVMESWPASARPVLAGLIGAAANVGFILAALLVIFGTRFGLQVANGGWRWVLGACAFPALLTFFIRMFVPESEKWQHAARTAPRARIVDIFSPDLWKHTLVGALLGGLVLIGTWGSVQWVPPWVNKITGSQGMTNLAQICLGVGAVIGSFCGPALGSGVRRRWLYFLLSACSLLSCAFLFRYFDGIETVGVGFLTTAVVVGMFTASFFGWLPLYLPELFPTRVRATGQGFSYNFGRVIAAGGALSMGFLMSKEGPFAGSYAKAGATISLVYALGMVVIWLAPETRGKPLPE